MYLSIFRTPISCAIVSRMLISQRWLNQASSKKVKLLLVLTVMSTTVHAQVSEKGDAEALQETSAGFTPHTTQQSTQDIKPSSEPMISGSPTSRLRQNRQLQKQLIPPPPPGPYISTSLNGYTVNVPVLGRIPSPRSLGLRNSGLHNPDSRFGSRSGSTSTPMAMFSPDLPWPNDLRPSENMPHGWMPQGGYSQINPQPSTQTMQRPTAPAYWPSARHPAYNAREGQQYGPQSRWMPTMSMSPPGPYVSSSQYRSNAMPASRPPSSMLPHGDVAPPYTDSPMNWGY